MSDKALLRQQLARYPKLQMQDLVKALYQSEFGPGHFVSDGAQARELLREELAECADRRRDGEAVLVEPLGETFARVHLQCLSESGLSADTLCRLFVYSAQQPSGDRERFRARLDALERCVVSGEIPLDVADAQAFLAQYRAAGCPATHHSQVFRQAYAPAYRVIAARFAQALPLMTAIERKLGQQARVIVAIEGGSASGKTSLARLLQQVYDCNVFHMDDFFLQPHQRTPERFAEPGGNVDRERFQEEVLKPLNRGGAFTYRVFDCSQMALGDSVDVQPKRLNIVEGAYSMHPALSRAYDISAFLSIDPERQAQRILQRNGARMQQRFLNEWIPLENQYFAHTGVADRCTLQLRME